MEKLILKLKECKSEIFLGHDIFKTILNSISNDKRKFYIIDKFIYEKFYNLYFKNFVSDIDGLYLLEGIENNKSIEKVISIAKVLSDGNYLRDTLLIAIGGGIIGDLAGFLSSIYMRGIKFINIPTTLLAQVDSSIGGKNAINLEHYKNLIGTFKQADSIIIDSEFLYSLGIRELISGLAEIIKYGIICEYSFLEYIANNLDNILNRDGESIRYIIKKSCEFKCKIVELDEHDFFIRNILNHGHTIGHAIEGFTNYSVYTHGEAIIIGMFYENLIAYKLNFIDKEYFDFIKNLLRKFKINFNPSILCEDKFYDILRMDKKNKLDKISFILPTGKSRVKAYMFSIDEIKKFNIDRYKF